MEEDESKLKEFPDVTQKLAAPKKLSAFEKDRQAAQAKEKRAEAENAAALKAFQDSFAHGDDEDDDDDDDELSQLKGGRGPPSAPRGPPQSFGGPPARYGMPPAPRSGPGSLGPGPGPGPGPPPPPPSLKRKRALDELREAQEARREQEMLGYEDSESDHRGTPQPVLLDEDRDVDAPRPTIQLSSLSPNISTDEVKALLRDYVKVQSVRFLPPSGPVLTAKRSASAIVTLSSDVATAQIDTAVSTLKDKYLGCGFYLSISRHLSSAAMHPSMATTTAAASTEPFGAEKPREQHPRFSMRNAPPPRDHRGFAPPDSYDSPSRGAYGNNVPQGAGVSVRPPLNIETIKAVHCVVDQLLLEPNPERALEVEAMLMALPEVQKDEKFAFLYDSRSPAGVYYRFLLWTPEDPDEALREMKRRAQGPERIHEDMAIEWLPPYAQIPFPDLKSLEQVVTDMDYISSEEESDDEDETRQFNAGREGDGPTETVEKKYLSPLKRARFVHMLSRLPTSNARLRKGDVARVTSFAINHAGGGAEEIVDLLLLNVAKPFSYSLASKYEESDQEQDEEDVYEPDEDLSNIVSPATQAQKDSKRDDDPSNAKLIALYLISDVLSASSTAGARNAWKYRQLFESGFKHQKTFEHLGKLDRELSWGRMKAEQWKRKVGVVFEIWDGWSVFSGDVHEELKKSFFEPPLSEEEKAVAQAEADREEKRKQEEKFTGKFKRVEQAESPGPSASVSGLPGAGQQESNEDMNGTISDGLDGAPLQNEIDGAPMDGVDGAPMDDIDGTPMGDGVDGVVLGGLDGTMDGEPAALKLQAHATPQTSMTNTAAPSSEASGQRRRMRAEDMFADSDDD